MRVTITGGSGLIGSRLVRALRARGDEVTVLSRRARDGSRARGTRCGPRRPRRWRPRRRRPPGRRERRPALERRRQAADRASRARSARATSSRRCARQRGADRGRWSAPPRVGYYGPHGDERVDEADAARRRLPGRGLRRVGARGQRAPSARACASSPSAPASCSTPTAARWRRCCRRSSSASAARSPAASQYMPWIHVDDVVGIYLAALDDATLARPGQRHRARARDERRVLQGARARAAPPRDRADSRLRDQGAVRRDGRDRDHRAACGARASPRLTGTPSRTRSSTRLCHPRLPNAPVRRRSVTFVPARSHHLGVMAQLPPDLERPGGRADARDRQRRSPAPAPDGDPAAASRRACSPASPCSP